ncbi:MAG: heat shock protein transcriptional repressor HspR [Candidatus Methylomirabilales bacterium]
MPRERRALYMISVVAEMFDIHPQTLRAYEREGLIHPARSDGNTRLYSEEDVRRIDLILRLTKELGVNLAGVEVILNMRERVQTMRREMAETFEAMLDLVEEELTQRRRDNTPGLVPVGRRGLIRRPRRPVGSEL